MRLRLSILLLVMLLTACRLGVGTAPSDPPATLPSASAAAETQSPPGFPTESRSGITEAEAIEIATEFRSDPSSTTFDHANLGTFAEVAPTMDNPNIEASQQVWAITFAGEYAVGCDYSDCPKDGTETVIVDLESGAVLMSQIHAP